MARKSVMFKVICLCCAVMLAASLLLLCGCDGNTDKNAVVTVQDLDYTDGTELTYNPDQGFYRQRC